MKSKLFKIDFNVDGHNGGQVWRSGFVSQFWNLCLFDIEPHGIFVPTIHEIVKNLNNGIIASIIAKNIKFKHDGASGCGCARQQKNRKKKGGISWRLNNTGTNFTYCHKLIPISVKVLNQMDIINYN